MQHAPPPSSSVLLMLHKLSLHKLSLHKLSLHKLSLHKLSLHKLSLHKLSPPPPPASSSRSAMLLQHAAICALNERCRCFALLQGHLRSVAALLQLCCRSASRCVRRGRIAAWLQQHRTASGVSRCFRRTRVLKQSA